MRGTTAQRSPGTWRLRVVTGYDAEGRRQQLSRTIRGTRRQAQSALVKFVAEVGQTRAHPPGQTHGRHIDRFVRSWEQTLPPSAVRATVGTVSAALEPGIHPRQSNVSRRWRG